MFGWGMNILILLALAWVFALSEDIWLNRTLGYQIQAEGEKRGVSPRAVSTRTESIGIPIAVVV
jgi:hypothetical protein